MPVFRIGAGSAGVCFYFRRTPHDAGDRERRAQLEREIADARHAETVRQTTKHKLLIFAEPRDRFRVSVS